MGEFEVAIGEHHRRQLREPQDPAGAAEIDAFGLGDLPKAGASSLVQQPLPVMGETYGAQERFGAAASSTSTRPRGFW